MKRIFFTALIAAFSATMLNAQQPGAPKQTQDKPKQAMNNSFDGLNLSASQQEKIQILKEQHKAQLEELKKQGASEEKIDAVRRDQKDQIMSVLTDEQKETWKKNKAAGKEEKLKKEKAIAAEGQNEKAAANNKEELKAQIKAIQSDSNLTEEQKKEKTKELLKKMNNEPGQVLSPEEAEKLKDKRKHNLEKKATN